MTNFNVRGPYDVPVSKLKAGRIIDSKCATAFWQDHPKTAKDKGCYVFAIRASKGIKPIYIGKATKNFKQEVFTDHKKNKYNMALASQLKGTPVLFFVLLGKSRGRTNKLAIDEVESYLIQAGLTANGNLLNDMKTAVESWKISGVVRSNVGKPSKSAQELKRCLNL